MVSNSVVQQEDEIKNLKILITMMNGVLQFIHFSKLSQCVQLLLLQSQVSQQFVVCWWILQYEDLTALGVIYYNIAVHYGLFQNRLFIFYLQVNCIKYLTIQYYINSANMFITQ